MSDVWEAFKLLGEHLIFRKEEYPITNSRTIALRLPWLSAPASEMACDANPT